jgi:hypothetical protein
MRVGCLVASDASRRQETEQFAMPQVENLVARSPSVHCRRSKVLTRFRSAAISLRWAAIVLSRDASCFRSEVTAASSTSRDVAKSAASAEALSCIGLRGVEGDRDLGEDLTSLGKAVSNVVSLRSMWSMKPISASSCVLTRSRLVAALRVTLPARCDEASRGALLGVTATRGTLASGDPRYSIRCCATPTLRH